MVLVKHLVWDEWNVGHILRHDVTLEEVEQVCNSDPVIQKAKKGRYLVYGLTLAGRMITVVLDPEIEEGVYYPVTARSTSKKERKIYQEEKAKESKNEK